MAFVDKEELYEAITDLPFTEGCAVYDSYDVENTIRNFPEADVVEVIRCKDCKYSVLLCNIEIDGIEEPCTIACKYESEILGANDFCSLAERKEGD